MWRGMLGDFDVTALQQPISILMFVFFQFIVVVILMNLIIAIMGGTCTAAMAWFNGSELLLAVVTMRGFAEG